MFYSPHVVIIIGITALTWHGETHALRADFAMSASLFLIEGK